MARFEILDSNMAPLGEGPASPDMLFELGMMYSVGRDVPVDLISAHKWFNLAAVKGNTDAIRLRRDDQPLGREPAERLSYRIARNLEILRQPLLGQALARPVAAVDDGLPHYITDAVPQRRGPGYRCYPPLCRERLLGVAGRSERFLHFGP